MHVHVLRYKRFSSCLAVKRSVPEVSAPTPATTLPRNVSGTSGGSGGGVGSNMAGKLKSIFKIVRKSPDTWTQAYESSLNYSRAPKAKENLKRTLLLPVSALYYVYSLSVQ